MGKKIVFILALVFVAFASKAQNTIISGIVTDSITGETLPYGFSYTERYNYRDND